jgi:hypothetical protein
MFNGLKYPPSYSWEDITNAWNVWSTQDDSWGFPSVIKDSALIFSISPSSNQDIHHTDSPRILAPWISRYKPIKCPSLDTCMKGDWYHCIPIYA